MQVDQNRRRTSSSVVLFLTTFTAQSSLLVMTPILPAVANEFGISTAAAAQLRSLTGLVAGCVAVWVAVRSSARPFRDLLLVGLILMSIGAAMSALSPSMAVLIVAQLAIGIGLGVLLPTALAAAGAWEPARESAVLAWALAGQPVAWIVGMPIVGFVAEASWRYAWIAVPLASSLVALAATLARPRDATPFAPPDERPMWQQPDTKPWAFGELVAYGGWSGTLVFVGALLVDSYHTSTTRVGIVLAIGAAAYVPGNFLAQRWAPARLRPTLIGAALLSGVCVVLLGAWRPGELITAAIFAAMAFLAGGRTFAGSSLGLRLAPNCKLQSMGYRTAAVQYGYLLGAALGGIAVALGGYSALGATLAVLFVSASVPHLLAIRQYRSRPSTPVR